ncbi:MAG TPA: hypothetical protein VED01_27850 [Burkholderiales bacterium]|nr:hypothetical protein [Burkholderiales bacterium]
MPHFRPPPAVIRNTRSLPRALFSAAFLVCFSAPLAAADGFDYTSNLREVFGAYQGVLARREACATAYPKLRAVSDKAYAGWQGRHRKLIDELDLRVAMMIRGASTDERDYARNVGKYEGAILRQREEVKKELLQQLPSDLEAMCKALPEFLRSADSDLEKAYAEELAIVRKRPLPGR